jgi:hypothetical protein
MPKSFDSTRTARVRSRRGTTALPLILTTARITNCTSGRWNSQTTTLTASKLCTTRSRLHSRPRKKWQRTYVVASFFLCFTCLWLSFSTKQICVHCVQAISREAMLRRCGGGARPQDTVYKGNVSTPPETTASVGAEVSCISPPCGSNVASFSSDAGSSLSQAVSAASSQVSSPTPPHVVPVSKVHDYHVILRKVVSSV